VPSQAIPIVVGMRVLTFIRRVLSWPPGRLRAPARAPSAGVSSRARVLLGSVADRPRGRQKIPSQARRTMFVMTANPYLAGLSATATGGSRMSQHRRASLLQAAKCANFVPIALSPLKPLLGAARPMGVMFAKTKDQTLEVPPNPLCKGVGGTAGDSVLACARGPEVHTHIHGLAGDGPIPPHQLRGPEVHAHIHGLDIREDQQTQPTPKSVSHGVIEGAPPGVAELIVEESRLVCEGLVRDGSCEALKGMKRPPSEVGG
jgi:hypothetical protein